LHNFDQLVEHGVEIPQQEGFLYDILALVISLIGSIFPGWQVRAFQVVPQPANNNANNQQNNNPNANNNNNNAENNNNNR
jgi:hypothetical protein